METDLGSTSIKKKSPGHKDSATVASCRGKSTVLHSQRCFNPLNTKLSCWNFNLVNTDQFSCEYHVSFALLVSNLRPFSPVSNCNCSHSSRSRCSSHFGSEANKVQRPCQILLKVTTFGLANEKYTQIAVVLVSAKCSPDHRECAKMCFLSVLKP